MDDARALAVRVALLRRALAEAEHRQRAGEHVALWAYAELLEAEYAAMKRALNRYRYLDRVTSHAATPEEG